PRSVHRVARRVGGEGTFPPRRMSPPEPPAISLSPPEPPMSRLKFRGQQGGRRDQRVVAGAAQQDVVPGAAERDVDRRAAGGLLVGRNGRKLYTPPRGLYRFRARGGPQWARSPEPAGG